MGKFVKKLIIFQGTNLVMGYGLIFIMQGGTWEFFSCLVMEKNGSIFQGLQVWGGNECLMIGNWTKQ